MKLNKHFVFLLVIIAVLVGGFFVYHHNSQKKAVSSDALRTAIAKKEPLVVPLYFSGMVEPIKSKTITSPVDARVKNLYFNYGDTVVDGEVVMDLFPTTLADDYHKAVKDYLDAKNTYLSKKTDFEATTALYKAGVVSQSDYLNEKSDNENNAISYMQSRWDLEKKISLTGVDKDAIESLTLSNVDQLAKVLSQSIDKIKVKSNAAGVALYPDPNQSSQSSEDESSGMLFVGSGVKEGQLLLTVGDLSGLLINVKVSEIDVNQLKKGMSAVVTGDAFPGVKLKGAVTSIASQADVDSVGGSGSLSEFSISVEVPSIPASAKKLIKVGMTCKIQIDLPQVASIIVPVGVVWQKQGVDTITVKNTDGTMTDVKVKTGITTPTGVVIANGIKVGDQVIYHD